MKIWEFELVELENPLNTIFERGYVKAENIDDALAKVKCYMKEAYSKLKLEISVVKFKLEVDLE